MEARWAHNPKVVGSNPTPATNFVAKKPQKQLTKSPSVNQSVNQLGASSTQDLATRGRAVEARWCE